ncbi:MAG: pyruvate carboxylase subunit B [Chloroflexi bacterium]|nr:pyruvate carboxylase subunit B [Chloroflexota bacterium]
MAPDRVGITEVVLRDGHQSLLATRLRLADMLEAAPLLDAVGFHSLEVWGGATFDSAMRFLNEDPWENLRQLRRALPNTPLQMLLRGQNVVGYRHYADDVVERFVERARANGMDIFRIFDALNDTRNLEVAMRTAKRVGGHVQGTICYTVSPVHDLESFAAMGRRLVEMGADSICVKDMAGLISPGAAYELVKRLKQDLGLPVQIHSHHTSGMASMALLKAVEAGCDWVDTAISTMSLGSSHPPTETMVSALAGSERAPQLDLKLLTKIARYFGEVRKRYVAFDEQLIGVDIDVLTYQVPGGMLPNLIGQLRDQNAVDRLDEVLAEVPRVRQDLGYPPLVTPSSQFVGTQAVLNVLVGERYKVVPREVQNYVLGYYGLPPAPMAQEVVERVGRREEAITGRPGDVLPLELEKARAEIGDLATCEEDVLSFVLFPQVARGFFERRRRGGKVEPDLAAAVAGLLSHLNSAQAGLPPPGRDGAGPAESAWKLMGRRAALRGSLWLGAR